MFCGCLFRLNCHRQITILTRLQAPVVQTCHALYDYDKQTEEEISFKEGDRFNIYDLSDADWLLVGDSANQVYGFVPSNYIQIETGAPGIEDPVPSQVQPVTISNFAPPPIHKDRTPQPVHQEQEERVEAYSEDEDKEDEEDEGPPPPMPTRPQQAPKTPEYVPTTPRPAANTKEEPEQANAQNPPGENDHGFDGEFFKWYIDEVDGRKKRPIKLIVGNGLIMIRPNTDNPKKLSLKSASSLNHSWELQKLEIYSQEKKHLFLEFVSPYASIELHAGSKDVAEAIIAVISDLKALDNAKIKEGNGKNKELKAIARATKADNSSQNRKIGVLLYDFESQGADELSCKEGEEVYIVNQSKSKEWWLCERMSRDAKQGVVPSSYIEIVGSTNLDKLTDRVSRTKSERSSKGKVISSESKKKLHHYNRDEREQIRESDRLRRDHSKPKTKDDKSMPNYHRVRTWIDSSGSFKVEAEFLGCIEGKIHLHKTNGVKIAVAATKLSIEDLEYVEKVTGTSLENYKEEVAKQSAKKKHQETRSNNASPVKSNGASGVSVTSSAKEGPRSATATINDVPPPQPTRPKATTGLTVNEPDYDWFEFFLQCSVDIGNCQRYSINFSKEQMDESVLEDITPSLLRSLGLREGDILRVMKFLDNKFDRKKAPALDAPAGGLFTEPTGALKNNSSAELSKVSASALPDPSPQKTPADLPPPSNAQKFEDDAWAVKPAARSSEDVSLPGSRPQYTGSLQDLVDIKPLEANPRTPQRDVEPLAPSVIPAAPALTPIKTGPLGASNLTSNTSVTPIKAISTGGPKQPNLVPVQTGGLMPVQPTGFVAINSQPTGFVPIQATGGILPQLTFGIVPLQTGVTTYAPPMGAQKTGEPLAGPPPTTFGQILMQPTNSFVPLQPGNVTMPVTSFNQSMTGNGSQPTFTGNGFPGSTFPAQVTGGISGQATGGINGQATGGVMKSTFVPQSAFGRQITGGFMAQQQTGGPPANSFGQQTGSIPVTGFGQQTGSMPVTSFGQQTGSMPVTSFGQQTGSMPVTSFGQQTGAMSANGFGQQNSFGQQFGGAPNFGQQTTGIPYNLNQQAPNRFNQFGSAGFAQQTGGFMQSNGQQTGGVNSFGQSVNGFGQQPTSFGQPGMPSTSFGQPNVDQVTNMMQNTSIGGAFAGQNPIYGNQAQFEGFGQPLQSQPTGAGFGNGPSLQAQATGRRANLQSATADNPFGF